MKYTLKCTKCHQQVTVEHAMKDPHPTIHQGCGGKLVRVFADVGVIYRGGGFYSTDRTWRAKGDSFE